MENKQQFQKGDRVVVASGSLKGTTGRLRRKFGRDEKEWMVDYDSYDPTLAPKGCGHHSPHELQHI
jgi:hypothetical protein